LGDRGGIALALAATLTLSAHDSSTSASPGPSMIRIAGQAQRNLAQAARCALFQTRLLTPRLRC